jgi:DNA-binding IclR family transcriptional regulator
MATVVEIRGKTEQRVQNVIRTLRKARGPLSYEELQRLTGSTYDALLYICSTLAEVGYVERLDVADGPGRPKVKFVWIGDTAGARAMGAR